jgi:hypothetical protein
LTNRTDENGSFNSLDTNAPGFPRRFFRATAPP